MNDSRDTSQSVGVVSVYKVVDSDDLDILAVRGVSSLDECDLFRPRRSEKGSVSKDAARAKTRN